MVGALGYGLNCIIEVDSTLMLAAIAMTIAPSWCFLLFKDVTDKALKKFLKIFINISFKGFDRILFALIGLCLWHIWYGGGDYHCPCANSFIRYDTP
jgi:hypothetical protein